VFLAPHVTAAKMKQLTGMVKQLLHAEKNHVGERTFTALLVLRAITVAVVGNGTGLVPIASKTKLW